MFERFSRVLGLEATRIPEASSVGERRPDFAVIGTNGTPFHAEVKLISPTREESEYIRRFADGEIFGMDGTPGARLRGLIAKANNQLKALASRGLPGALVVFNPEPLLHWHTDPYFVLTAMRGLDVVDVSVPMNPHESPAFGPLRSGPNKRMTRSDNTSTAAVICPREVGADEWLVDVYHNRFAARPLPATALAHSFVQHWYISDDEREWSKAPATRL
ncbi:MAG: hypothetical protein LC667_18155 [Thioalkalivibrio sp.]|nr:hypothetical protein [Thioalkalivibrio sp.]